MTAPDSPPPGIDVSAMLNAQPDGWGQAMGLRFERATPDEVVITWEVGPHHRQPMGLVHGGVYCGVIEAACSVGAAITQGARGLSPTAVGLENHTSFIRAAREGKLKATARPLTRGRTTQVWEAEVRDENDQLLATGRVRLLCVDPNQDPRMAAPTQP